jgi:hypothetical protein
MTTDLAIDVTKYLDENNEGTFEVSECEAGKLGSHDNKSVHLPNYYVRLFSIGAASIDPGVSVQDESLEMSRNELLLLMLTFANIKKEDDCFKPIQIPLVDLCRRVGAELGGSSNYATWARTIRRLASRLMIFVDENEVVTFCPYFSTCRLNPRDKMVTMKLNSDLSHIFLNVCRDKTIFQFGYLRQLSSSNAMLFYLLGSSARIGDYSLLVNLEHLKRTHGYAGETKHFISDVLLPCLYEINDKTNLNITLEYVREGRSIYAIKLFVDEKTPAEMLAAQIGPENKRQARIKRLTPELKKTLFASGSNKPRQREIAIGF